MKDQFSLGDIIAKIMGRDVGPFVNTVSLEFEITAKQADDITIAYTETQREEPDADFSLFHAIVAYITVISEAGVQNYASRGSTGLSLDDTMFVVRVKAVIGALTELNYRGKEHAELAQASIGPKAGDPNKAIVRITL